MLRRLLLPLTLFIFVSGLIFAVQLEVWEYGMATEFVMIIQELADQEFTPKTGIKVNLVVNPYEGMMTKVLLAIASGEPPDVLSGAADHIIEYGIRGALVPMRVTFKEQYEKIASYLYSGDALDHKNQGYGLVESVGLVIGFQRTDILAKLGLEYPTTWSELYKILPKLRSQGHDVAWSYGGPALGPQWGALTLMRQHGGGFVHRDDFRSLLNDKGSIAGFKEYVEFYTVHKMPLEVNWFNMFKSGELAILFDVATRYSAFDTGAPEISSRWSYGLIPGTPKPDGSISHEAMMGTGGIAIANQSKHKKEAFQYIEWYLQDDTQIKIMERLHQRMKGAMWITGNIKAANTIPILQADRKILADQLKSSTPFYYFPGAMSINRYIEFAVHDVLQKGTSPEKAIADAHLLTEQELRAKLQEYNRFISKLSPVK